MRVELIGGPDDGRVLDVEADSFFVRGNCWPPRLISLELKGAFYEFERPGRYVFGGWDDDENQDGRTES